MDKSYWEGKRVLVTGGEGFIGRVLVSRLSSLGSTVHPLSKKEYNLVNFDDASRAFTSQSEGNPYDFIFHLAVLHGGGTYPREHRAEQFYTNMALHTNVLENWRRHQPHAKFVAAGSTCAYPGHLSSFSETQFFEGPLHESVETYGLTKRALLEGIRAYKSQYGLRGTFPILSTVFGPGAHFDERAHVVGSLVARFCKAAEEKQPEMIIWGDGNQTRELIYVEDQVEGLLRGALYEGDIINVGSGKGTSIRELAESLQRVTGYQGRLVFDATKFVGAVHKISDVSLAQRELGWPGTHQMCSLEKGLEKTVASFLQNTQTFKNSRDPVEKS